MPSGLKVTQLKPFHVQQWLDAHPNWNDSNRRGHTSWPYNEPFAGVRRWVTIHRLPIESIEKPKFAIVVEVAHYGDIELD